LRARLLHVCFGRVDAGGRLRNAVALGRRAGARSADTRTRLLHPCRGLPHIRPPGYASKRDLSSGLFLLGHARIERVFRLIYFCLQIAIVDLGKRSPAFTSDLL